MSLEELIELYKREDYSFFKYKDITGNEIKTHFVFESHTEYLDKYLNFYKNLPNLTEVIVHAPDGIFKITNDGLEYFIRHNHQEVFIDRNGNQRGVPYETSKKVRDNLFKRLNEILKCRTFDEIYEIVNSCKEKGFGELSIYDASMRIAVHMNIEPDKIYLHAGARIGMETLESKGYVEAGTSKKKFVLISEMPRQMQKLKAAESEHMLCSMKENIANLDPK